MTAPSTGAADAPETPANPMAAAVKPTINTVRIVRAPSIIIAPMRFSLMQFAFAASSALGALPRQAAPSD
jgi:hypothetical protein